MKRRALEAEKLKQEALQEAQHIAAEARQREEELRQNMVHLEHKMKEESVNTQAFYEDVSKMYYFIWLFG